MAKNYVHFFFVLNLKLTNIGEEERMKKEYNKLTTHKIKHHDINFIEIFPNRKYSCI